MAKARPTTRAERRAKRPATVPSEFVPQFWEEADKRQAVVKEIRRRYELLKEHASADSCQRDLLVQRAVFIAVQLETMEINAAQTGAIDPGVYTQMTNTLLGLLKTLGLDRKLKQVVNLDEYVKGKGQ